MLWCEKKGLISSRVQFAALVFGSVVADILFYNQSFPSLCMSSSMWAESGPNFFLTARTGKLVDNLSKLDFAYLPFLPRVWALTVEAFNVPDAHLPSAYHICAFIWQLTCRICFLHPGFRCVAPDVVRAFLCLGLATHGDYELRTFINSSYWGIVPLWLCIAYPQALARTNAAMLAGVSVLLAATCLSKSQFIVFTPALCLMSYRHRSHGKKPMSFFYLLPLAAAIIQAYVVGHAAFRLPQPPSLPVSERLIDIVRAGGALIGNVLMGDISLWQPEFWADVYSPAIVGVVALVVCVYGGKKKLLRPQSRQLIAIFTIVAGLCLVTTAYPHPFGGLWAKHPDASSRGYFAFATILYLEVGVALAEVFEGSRLCLAVIAIWLSCTHPFGLHQPKPARTWPWVQYSGWQQLNGAARRIRRQSAHYCIPVDPYGWDNLVSTGCELLTPWPSVASTNAQPSQPFQRVFPLPPNLETSLVELGGFILGDTGQQKSILRLFDRSGIELATAVGLAPPGDRFTFYGFEPAVSGAALASITLLQTREPAALVQTQAIYLGEVSVWYGSKAPSPCAERYTSLATGWP